VAQARGRLLDLEEKAEYDAQLREQHALPGQPSVTRSALRSAKIADLARRQSAGDARRVSPVLEATPPLPPLVYSDAFPRRLARNRWLSSAVNSGCFQALVKLVERRRHFASGQSAIFAELQRLACD